MDVEYRFKIINCSSPDDLVWLASQIESWKDQLLDREGWNGIVEREPLSDLQNGEIPKSGGMRVRAEIERLHEDAVKLGVKLPTLSEHHLEQGEAASETLSPRGSVFAVIQVSTEDPTLETDVIRVASNLLTDLLAERTNTLTVDLP